MVDKAGHRDRVRIAEVVVSCGLRDEDPACWQLLLRRSLVSGERPLCLCRGGGTVSLLMVIATHGRTLVMKRMRSEVRLHVETPGGLAGQGCSGT